MEENRNLIGLIEDALRLNRELWGKYKAYPPVSHSKTMLEDIIKLLDKNERLSEIKKHSELNVGLLASKSLDLDGDIDLRLVSYGHALHLVWSKISPIRFFRLNRKQRRAYRFFIKHGIQKSDISGYMSGIDFRRDVRIALIALSVFVYQWDIPNQKGDYFAPDINSTQDCLGVNEKKADKNDNNVIKDREHETYKLLNSVKVLDSTAAKTVDTWSVEFQKGVPVSGGCRQYFNRKDKDLFEKQ